MNLFTNAEKLLLNKYNIDYLNNTKDDLIEIFSDKNLDTLEDDKKQIGNTKSIILAPYNSFANNNDSLCNKFILIENNICKFRGKAQHANLKYELNNNNDFDNGVIMILIMVLLKLNNQIIMIMIQIMNFLLEMFLFLNKFHLMLN